METGVTMLYNFVFARRARVGWTFELVTFKCVKNSDTTFITGASESV